MDKLNGKIVGEKTMLTYKHGFRGLDLDNHGYSVDNLPALADELHEYILESICETSELSSVARVLAINAAKDVDFLTIAQQLLIDQKICAA